MDIGEIKQYIRDIQMYRDSAAGFDDDSPGALVRKVELLTQAHMLMGRVSAYMHARHARTYNERKRVYAETMLATKKGNKQTAAELAIIKLREQEAEDLERMHLWKNEFKSVSEQLYELRLRLRIDLMTGGGGG